MEIILLQDVRSLGKKGEIKKVADGYARNFLLPRKLAQIVTPQAIQAVEKVRQEQAQQVEQEKTAKKKLLSRIKDIKIEIESKADQQGKLFGSVTTKEIAYSILKEEKIELKEKDIKLKTPIKELGKYEIEIDLGDNLKTTIKVVVKEEN